MDQHEQDKRENRCAACRCDNHGCQRHGADRPDGTEAGYALQLDDYIATNPEFYGNVIEELWPSSTSPSA